MVTNLSVVCVFSMYSSDFSIASCSAWLFVHLLFSLYFKLLMSMPDLNTAMPAPNSCFDLLPSVNISVMLLFSLLSRRMFMYVCIYVRTYVCMYVFMYVYTYVCMYVCYVQ